jgi:hypothetical protein
MVFLSLFLICGTRPEDLETLKIGKIMKFMEVRLSQSSVCLFVCLFVWARCSTLFRDLTVLGELLPGFHTDFKARASYNGFSATFFLNQLNFYPRANYILGWPLPPLGATHMFYIVSGHPSQTNEAVKSRSRGPLIRLFDFI